MKTLNGKTVVQDDLQTIPSFLAAVLAHRLDRKLGRNWLTWNAAMHSSKIAGFLARLLLKNGDCDQILRDHLANISAFPRWKVLPIK